MKVLIIISQFNSNIYGRLLRIAKYELEKAHAKFEIVEVPGAFELPAALAFAANSQLALTEPQPGYVILGCVLRSETPHFEYVCNSASYGIMKVAIEKDLAVGFGLITANNEGQALVRSDIDRENNYAKKAVEACLHMLNLKSRFAHKVIENANINNIKNKEPEENAK